MYRVLIICSTLLLESVAILGQEITPRGYFSKDTILIGEHIDFTIVVDYPRELEVLFPDSTYDYHPFEFLGKSYLNTISDKIISNDSVVFHLATFEMDTIQKLRLPIFLVIEGDSTKVDSNQDSLFLQLLITENVDSLNVQETIDYQKVSRAFNYPYLLIAFGIIVVIAILIAIFFGKVIKRRFKLYRLRRAHLKFLDRFKLLQNEGLESSDKAEHILGFWKAYLERLEGMPYTKLTTKEIATFEQNKDLKETLRSIDSSIYGEFKKSDINELVSKLKEFGIDKFIQKIDELNHA